MTTHVVHTRQYTLEDRSQPKLGMIGITMTYPCKKDAHRVAATGISYKVFISYLKTPAYSTWDNPTEAIP